jgi:hypothetical protein
MSPKKFISEIEDEHKNVTEDVFETWATISGTTILERLISPFQEC